MVTFAGTQNDIEGLVKALINLEHDALQAYDATISRLENAECIHKITEFRADHLQHINALEQIAAPMNIETGDGSVKSLLTQGKVVIADMMGDDSAILKAMKTNENDTVSAYKNALEQDFLTAELRQICEKGLQDERRHRDWMEQASNGNYESGIYSEQSEPLGRTANRI